MRSTPDIETGNRLTHGGLLRGIIYLSGPMLISSVLQNAQSLIDLFWVGRLGRNAVAAVALSGVVLMMMFPVIAGLATAVVAMVSRALGAGREESAARAAGQSLLAGAAFGLAAGAAGWLAAEYVLKLLGAEPEVVRIGAGYLSIAALGFIAVSVFFVASSILHAAGNTVAPMIGMLIANALNLALDPIMIFGLLGFPRLEAKGAALATVMSHTLAAAILVVLLFRKDLCFGLGIRHLKPRPGVLWALARLGLPNSGQLLSRSLMSLVLMRVVAGHGTAAVAAYGIGVRFHMIALMPAFALGGAAAVMMGQNFGAGSPARGMRASWVATGVCVCIMALASAILVPWAREMVGVFAPCGETRDIGAAYLRIVTPFYIFAGLSIVLGRAVNGAGDTVAPMVTTILALWGLQVPLAILLPGVMFPPTNGIWFAIVAAVTIHGIMNAAWFISGRWRKKDGTPNASNLRHTFQSQNPE